jgi:hypothetical protein
MQNQGARSTVFEAGARRSKLYPLSLQNVRVLLRVLEPAGSRRSEWEPFKPYRLSLKLLSSPNRCDRMKKRSHAHLILLDLADDSHMKMSGFSPENKPKTYTLTLPHTSRGHSSFLQHARQNLIRLTPRSPTHTPSLRTSPQSRTHDAAVLMACPLDM